jgi:hypothetical protein
MLFSTSFTVKLGAPELRARPWDGVRARGALLARRAGRFAARAVFVLAFVLFLVAMEYLRVPSLLGAASFEISTAPP